MAKVTLLFILTQLLVPMATKPTPRSGYTPFHDPTTTIDYDLADFDEFGLDPVTPSAVDYVGMPDYSGNADSAPAEPLYGVMFGTSKIDSPHGANWNMRISTTTPDTNADVSVEDVDIAQTEGGPTDEGEGTRLNRTYGNANTDTVGNDGDELSVDDGKNLKSRTNDISKTSYKDINLNTTTGSEKKNRGTDGEANDPDVDTGMDDTEKGDTVKLGNNLNKDKSNAKLTPPKATSDHHAEMDSTNKSFGSSNNRSNETVDTNPMGQLSTGQSSSDRGSGSSGSASASSESKGASSSSSSESSNESGSSSHSLDTSSSREGNTSTEYEGSNGDSKQAGTNNGGVSSGGNTASTSSESSSSSQSQSSESTSSESASASSESFSNERPTSGGNSSSSSESLQYYNGNSDERSGSDSSYDFDSSETNAVYQCFDPSANQHDLCHIVRALKMVCLIQFPSDCSSNARKRRSPSSNSQPGSKSENVDEGNSIKYSATSSGQLSLESPERAFDTKSSDASDKSSISSSSASSGMSLETLSIESLSESLERTQSISEVMGVIKGLCPSICAAAGQSKRDSDDADDNIDTESEIDEIESDSRDDYDSTIDSDESFENSVEFNYPPTTKESDESVEHDSVELDQDMSDDASMMSNSSNSPESPESDTGLSLDTSDQSTSTESTDSGTLESGASNSDNTSR